RRIEVVGLAREEHDVVARPQLSGEHRLHVDARIAERALDAQALARDLLAAPGAHQEGDIGAGLREPPAEIAADASGAEDEDPHPLPAAAPGAFARVEIERVGEVVRGGIAGSEGREVPALL